MEKYIDVTCYTVKPGKEVSDLEPEIKNILKEVYYIAPDDKQVVMKPNAEAVFLVMGNLLIGIHVLIQVVGLGTPLTGVIGVSSTVMVTIKGRTMEIGIRRAVGAHPKDILQQISSKSMVLITVAGMAGTSFGVLILQLMEIGTNSSKDHHSRPQVFFGMAIGTCLLLVTLGLPAGLAPVYRAMATRPIEATRDE